jgi:pilus assembly protein Flp/PilA
MLLKFIKDTSGATAIEYSFIAAMTGIIAIGAITLLGSDVGSLHDGVAEQVVSVTRN